ncbi:YgjP-like metallopeptidase domain-containing protein [Pontibacter coccineus]|uniref:YgjP-like metallopeptidase domain-containing protein n=1 Tax=Pontibacter coccineus TaxID=3063328 RepID=UPI0034A3FFA9
MSSLPRLNKLEKLTGLIYTDIKVPKMEKPWASCTASNQLTFNCDVTSLSIA